MIEGTPDDAAPDESGYTIPPPPDDRPSVITAFVVVIDQDGKAIANSEIEKTLAGVQLRREAGLDDMRRACAEVVNDVAMAMQSQHLLQMQMQMARQVQEQALNAEAFNSLDLSKMKQG